MFRVEVIARKVLFAAICGLLLTGCRGSFIFASVKFNVPGSFRGLSGTIPAGTDMLPFTATVNSDGSGGAFFDCRDRINHRNFVV